MQANEHLRGIEKEKNAQEPFLLSTSSWGVTLWNIYKSRIEQTNVTLTYMDKHHFCAQKYWQFSRFIKSVLLSHTSLWRKLFAIVLEIFLKTSISKICMCIRDKIEKAAPLIQYCHSNCKGRTYHLCICAQVVQQFRRSGSCISVSHHHLCTSQ